MRKIDHAGIYLDFSTADYFADPCPAPSLTQSVAKILLAQSPLHAWHAHPRLNPDWKADDDRKFDVGSIAHALLIGRGKQIEVLDFPDWRKQDAKDAREAAAKAGKLAVLAKHYALAERMVKAAREQLELRKLGHLFKDGSGEVVVAWQEDGIWLRQMIDWLTPAPCTFVDFKTTDMIAAPAALGRKMLDMAVAQWRACLKADRWPGYPTEIIRPEIPGWFEQQVLEREIENEERRTLPMAKFDGENLRAG